MQSVFIYFNGHKRGKNYRPVVGVEIQTNLVTLKRICDIVAPFWVASLVCALSHISSCLSRFLHRAFQIILFYDTI